MIVSIMETHKFECNICHTPITVTRRVDGKTTPVGILLLEVGWILIRKESDVGVFDVESHICKSCWAISEKVNELFKGGVVEVLQGKEWEKHDKDRADKADKEDHDNETGGRNQ